MDEKEKGAPIPQPGGKRMGSITGKLYRAYAGKKIGFFIGEDIFIFLLIVFGILFLREYLEAGTVSFLRDRCLALSREGEGFWSSLRYDVYDAETGFSLTVAMLPVIKAAGFVVIFLAAWQTLSFLFSGYSDRKRIRSILSPLMDIALKADELNRLSFGEDKYHRIEDAIERIQVDESETLSFGDKDLQGIEAAMNNLLKRMRNANMQQARFVNDASHELRTPIAVIKGYANMLDRWGKEDEKVLTESIEAIKNESDHMDRLVEQLLFLARGDAGRTELKPEEFELNDFMREIYEEALMIDEDHAYRFYPVDEELYVTADRALLKQAVRVLLDNAAKFTKKGEEIGLSVGKLDASEGSRMYLQVQDSGMGIKESEVAHIFERFYRSEDVRSYQGTGLGLSIAKWIVDKHGAHFEVLSREGLGTRIRVVL